MDTCCDQVLMQVVLAAITLAGAFFLSSEPEESHASEYSEHYYSYSGDYHTDYYHAESSSGHSRRGLSSGSGSESSETSSHGDTVNKEHIYFVTGLLASERLYVVSAISYVYNPPHHHIDTGSSFHKQF